MERIVDIPSDIETIKVGLNDPLFTKMLTGFPVREEIIRCRDCRESREKGWKCTRFSEEIYDEAQEVGELVMANTRPDGYCFRAEKRES